MSSLQGKVVIVTDFSRAVGRGIDGKVLPEKSLTMPLKYIGSELSFRGHLGTVRMTDC